MRVSIFSGLSATIGSPEIFNKWLESVQQAHGYEHTFIEHPYRYSHLRKFYYALEKESQASFEGLDTYQSTGRARFLHPIAMLSFGARSLPPDLSLEASDVLTLYQAMTFCQGISKHHLEALDPRKFFLQNQFLRQEDIIRYESALKEVLADLIASYDPRDSSSPVHTIVERLRDPVMARISGAAPSRESYLSNMIHLIADLHTQGELVRPSLLSLLLSANLT